MPIKVLMSDLVGDKRAIGLEGEEEYKGWKRIVIVVDQYDTVNVDYVDGNPDKLLLTLVRSANSKGQA